MLLTLRAKPLTSRLLRILALAPLALTLNLASAQNYIPRYDAYIGYAYFNSPATGLPEHGVHFQIGMNMRSWYALGFDYSRASGDLFITEEVLPTALQDQLRPVLEAFKASGTVPASYVPRVPVHSETQTFAAGPQLVFRRWNKFIPFLRPSIGAIREVATPLPSDPITELLTAEVAPVNKPKLDWQAFYGVGFGADYKIGKHMGLRVQLDIVRNHLFDDILRNPHTTFRFSVGPSFQFGRDIRK